MSGTGLCKSGAGQRHDGPTAEQLRRLASLLRHRVGLHIREESFGALRLAVTAVLGPTPGAAEVESWLHALEEREEELRKLLPFVTVGKTSFFRDERQFAALAELLPGWLSKARLEGRRLAIWSAGCATGEETWSVAIAALEAGAEPAELELLGTDVNPAAVEFARRGSYPLARIEGLSEDRLARHFERNGAEAAVRPQLRRAISAFEVHNLTDRRHPAPAAGSWDAIFCRNVLIYFDLPTMRQVLDRFHAALRPGGYLFLGYSESLFRLYEGFELVERAGSFVYRKPEQPRPAPSAPTAVSFPPPVPPRPPRPPERTSERVPERPTQIPPPAAPAPAARVPDLQEIGAAIAAGRFGEARTALEERVTRFPGDLGARLTLANLYDLLRLPEPARACYEAALEMEPLHAETHLLYGIHLLAGGEVRAAADALSRALFLDPDLGIGHYFLGRCRERLSDLEGARRAYHNAVRAFAEGKRPRRFLGIYPDLPEGGAAFARAAEGALLAL